MVSQAKEEFISLIKSVNERKCNLHSMKNLLYREIIENYIEAYNNFDIDGMLSYMHDEIRFKNIVQGKVNISTSGIAELKNLAENTKNQLKEREQKITDIKFMGNRAEVLIDYKGILAADIPNGPKAGDKIELKGKSVFTFQDNKIIELKDIS